MQIKYRKGEKLRCVNDGGRNGSVLKLTEGKVYIQLRDTSISPYIENDAGDRNAYFAHK